MVGDQGKSVVAVASELGLPYSTVNSWVRRSQPSRTSKQNHDKLQLEAAGPRHTIYAKLVAIQTVLWIHLLDAENQTLESALVEITGLSRSRVRQGRLDRLRRSRQQAVEQHQHEWLVKQLGGGIKGEERAHLHVENSPQTPLAASIHALAPDTSFGLPYTTAIATKFDRAILALQDACAAGDLVRFCEALRSSFALAAPEDMSHKYWSDTSFSAHVDETQTLWSWNDLAPVLSEVLDWLYFDLLAALDAEWFAWWFGHAADRPMFSLVFPSMPGVQEQDGKLRLIARRNAIKGPVRSLMQLMHGLVHFKRHGKWPSRAAGPRTLWRCLRYEEREISNFFDGTRRLSMKQADKMWDRLLLNFQVGLRRDGVRITPPYPLMVLAISLQKRMVSVNSPGPGWTVTVPDKSVYARLWSVHSRILRSRANDTPAAPVMQAPRSMAWPTWL